jgi:hypothetical protein
MRRGGRVRIATIPKSAWQPFLEVVMEHHTGVYSNFSESRGIVGRNGLKLIGLPVPVAGPVSS